MPGDSHTLMRQVSYGCADSDLRREFECQHYTIEEISFAGNFTSRGL